MVGSIVCALYFAVGGTMLLATLIDPENREEWSEMQGHHQIGYGLIFLFLWPLILLPGED